MFIIGEVGQFELQRRYVLLFGAILGVFTGIFNEFFGFRTVRKLRAWFRLPLQIAIIQIIIVLTVLAFRAFVTLETDEDEQIGVWAFLTGQESLSLYYKGQIFAFSLLFLFELEMVLGRRYLINYISGRYDRPKKEHRIILFMDLVSSTSIAERLGDDKYYGFLNDCYHFLSYPVMDTRAEVLKYVGDEVILSWNYKKGMKNNNALKFIISYQDILLQNSEYFLKKYGLKPEFKFGMNEGKVVAAYLGDIKRQLDLSGDVMNATARIVESCKKYDTDILIAEALFRDFNLEGVDYEFIMDAELRGKKVRMNLVKLHVLNS